LNPLTGAKLPNQSQHVARAGLDDDNGAFGSSFESRDRGILFSTHLRDRHREEVSLLGEGRGTPTLRVVPDGVAHLKDGSMSCDVEPDAFVLVVGPGHPCDIRSAHS
jgi:hypothetical protein